MNNLILEVIVFFVYIFINKNEFLKILKKVRGSKILYGFTIVHKGQVISKVRYGDTYYYTLTTYLE
jgi:hypothetical protein